MKNVLVRLLEVAVAASMVVLILLNFKLRRDLEIARAELRNRAKVESADGPKRFFQQGDKVDPMVLVPCATCRTSTANWPAGQKVMIVVNPSCPSCETAITSLQAALPTLRLPFVIVSTDDDSSTEKLVQKYKLRGAVLRIPRNAPQHFKYAKSPQIVLVDEADVRANCESVAQCAAIASGQPSP